MIEGLRSLCSERLTGKRLDSVYGLGDQDGTPVPRFFDSAGDLRSLVLGGKQRLVFTCRPSKKNVIALLKARRPGLKLGIVAKGCDERALLELAKLSQLSLDGIEIIGVACDREQAEECRCGRPYPNNPLFGEKLEESFADPAVERFQRMEPEERMAFWQHHLGKCMKCYGCRNACPMCFCTECQMERDLLVPRGALPPDFPFFHFIHMMHLADRCIDCGACEDACPMDIPLRLLKKTMRAGVRDLFGYEPGVNAEGVSPFAAIARGDTTHAE
ncbi:MAG: (Fe-S)-binding protein [Proteobacteria bacterium]|jgi:ferredoxin|nr:(Fe-S)-binding protein [Pseudomonadota bacterium]